MRKTLFILPVAALLVVLTLAACGGQNPNPDADASYEPTVPAAATETSTEEQPAQDADHDEAAEEEGHEEGPSHLTGAAGDELENPVEPTEASIARGKEVYANSCSVCHGDTGKGDGPGGKGFDPPPANLGADHVQVLTDGALFTIIHNGVEGTGMPGFEDTLEEEDIWNLVNYIRTLKE